MSDDKMMVVADLAEELGLNVAATFLRTGMSLDGFAPSRTLTLKAIERRAKKLGLPFRYETGNTGRWLRVGDPMQENVCFWFRKKEGLTWHVSPQTHVAPDAFVASAWRVATMLRDLTLPDAEVKS